MMLLVDHRSLFCFSVVLGQKVAVGRVLFGVDLALTG